MSAPVGMTAMVEPVAISDPSELTTRQMLREIAMLKELTGARQDAADKAAALFHEDLVRVPTAVDKAVMGLKDLVFSEISRINAVTIEHFARIDTVFQAQVVTNDAAFKAQRDAARDAGEIMRGMIDRLAEVAKERFSRIDTQFQERDKRIEQNMIADKAAAGAALSAAREAVLKSEASTTESLKLLHTLFNTTNNAMHDKINDVKSRLDKGDGRVTASTEVRTDTRANVGLIISACIAGVVIVSAIVGIVMFVAGSRSVQAPIYLAPPPIAAQGTTR